MSDDRSVCCADWAAALEPGTDNEGYGALIQDAAKSPTIGYDLLPVKFCPWCGTPKPHEHCENAGKHTPNTIGSTDDEETQ